MKKRIIAFLCVLSMCITTVMPVAAEGNEKTNETIPTINSIAVVTEPESGRDAMAAGEEFDVEVNLNAPDGTVIQEIDLNYTVEDEEKISMESYWYYFGEEDGVVEGEAKDFSLPVAPGKYAKSGQYSIESIAIYYGEDWDVITYSWDEDENALVADYQDDRFVFEYNKEIDFTILPHDFEDVKAPEIMSLKIAESVDKDAINITSELELEIGCKDDKSGIALVQVEFYNEENDNYEYFRFEADESQEPILDGVILLQSSVRRAGNYKLEYIGIEDYSGRFSGYWAEYDEDGKLISMDGKEDVISDYSYKVAKNNLQVESISMEKKEYTPGEDVEAYLTIYNPTNKEITIYPDEWTAVYETEYEGQTMTGKLYGTGEEESYEIQPDSTCTVKLADCLSTYTYSGERKLAEIVYENYDNSDISYSYEYDGNGKMVLLDNEEVNDSFEYKGEADFSVANSNVDVHTPDLKELKLYVNSEDEVIRSDTEMYMEASYEEKGKSGISEISVEYYSEEGGSDWFDIYVDEGNELLGTGKVKLESDGRAAGTYKLSYIYISDVAGNDRSWYVEYEDDVPMIDGEPLSEVFGEELIDTYTVLPAEYKNVKIKHLSVSENAKNLTAGDEFEITVVLQNDTDNMMRVYPEDWFFEWEAEEDDGSYYPEVYGSGAAFNIEANSSNAFSFVMKTNPFTHTGERKLRGINYSSNETGEDIISYTYDDENEILVASDGWGNEIDLEPSLAYHGELDWNVTKADQYDATPIEISDIEIKTKDIKAPGTVVFRVNLKDEGPAKMSQIYFDMIDVNESRNYISMEPIENGITRVSDKCYDVTMGIDEDVIAGTYKFDYIYAEDEAEMGCSYYLEDGLMTDGEYSFEAPDMVIVESECKDEDFDRPVLKDVIVPDTVNAGESLPVKFSIEDESGLYDAMIRLISDEQETALNIECEKIEKNADGTYTVYFPIGKYTLGGEYELGRIYLQDDSVHHNSGSYIYDEEIQAWQATFGDFHVVPYNKNRIVTVKQTTDVPVIDNDELNLSKAIAEAKEGDTIVVTYTDGEDSSRKLSKTNLLAAKAKKLNLIICQSGQDDELHIKAKDIPDNIPDTVYMSLMVDGVYYSDIQIEGIEEPDTISYEIYLRMTADNIPVTIRVPVNEEFEGKVCRLVGYNEDGRYLNELIFDNLVEKDGVVEVNLPNGTKDLNYSYSDGTYVLILSTNDRCDHKWETKWSYDAKEHWYECEAGCGTKGQKASHDFKWIIDKEATEKETGLKHEECSVCHYKKAAVVIDKLVHEHAWQDTWTTDANKHWHECDNGCGQKGDEADHDFEWILDKEATETETGLKHEECTVCKLKRNENTVIEKVDHVHEMKKTDGKAATCTEDGNKEYYTCAKCNKIFQDEKGNLETTKEAVVIKAAGHKYEWIIDKEPTMDSTGLKHEECSVCHDKRNEATVIDKLQGDGFGTEAVYRIKGKTRYETSFKTADALKKQFGVEKFNTVIVACGTNFADALAGSYLASVKGAPILMANEADPATLAAYIKANLNSNGTVYILGGTGAVSTKVENAIIKDNPQAGIIRLSGKSRYDTNILILQEAGVTNQDILVCTGKGFADSLSASALGRPILLVDKQLASNQKKYLDRLNGNKIYIIGGTGAVSETVEKELKSYGTPVRLKGKTRYETSVIVAENFFSKPSTAVLAYGENFPDGLSGGPLAMSKNAPLILTSTKAGAAAIDYANKAGINKGAVLGGDGLISDEVTKAVFNADKVVLWD